MTSSFVLEVDVKNEGLNSLSNIPVHYKLNGGTTVSESITGPVAPGATVSYTFTTSPTPISGNNSLLIWSDMTGDGNSLNDSVSTQFNYNTAAPKPYLGVKILKHLPFVQQLLIVKLKFVILIMISQT